MARLMSLPSLPVIPAIPTEERGNAPTDEKVFVGTGRDLSLPYIRAFSYPRPMCGPATVIPADVGRTS